MKHSFLGIAGAAALLLAMSGCGEELATMQEPSAATSPKEIIVNIRGFEGTDTRTTAAVDKVKGVTFYWAEGDEIGVFPESGAQASFSYAGSNKFTGGKDLNVSSSYSSYYPYDTKAETSNAVSVSFLGQAQKGNDNSAHVGAYDYMASAATAASGSTLTLDYQHLSSFVMLDLELPVAGELSSVTLSADKAVIPAEGTIDLTATAPAITVTDKVSTFSLGVEDVTAKTSDPVTLYMMMPPVDLSSAELSVTVEYVTGEICKGILKIAKAFAASKAYALSASLQKEGGAEEPSEEPSEEYVTADFVGTWYCESDGEFEYTQLKADGTYIDVQEDKETAKGYEVYYGKWSVSDDKLILNVETGFWAGTALPYDIVKKEKDTITVYLLGITNTLYRVDDSEILPYLKDDVEEPSEDEPSVVEPTNPSSGITGLWKCIETTFTSADETEDFDSWDVFVVGDAIKFFDGEYSVKGLQSFQDQSGKKCMIGKGGTFSTSRGKVSDPTEIDWNNNVEYYGDYDIEFDYLYTLSGNSLKIEECDLDCQVGTISIEGDIMTFTYTYQNWNWNTGVKTAEYGPFTSKFKKQ